MSEETFGHPIEVLLTEDERIQRLKRNLDIDQRMNEIKNEKAAANSGFNEDLKTLRKEQITLMEAYNTGKSKVEVLCYHDRDDRRGIMLTRRKDNGDIVDERALTAEERGESVDARQGKLFDEGSGEPSADAVPPAEVEEELPTDADAEATLDDFLASSDDEDEDDSESDSVEPTAPEEE